MRRLPSGYWQIEVRDRRLRGGRASLSARTKSVTEARKREAAFREAVERGEDGIVEAVRRGAIPISDLPRALRDGGLERLRPADEGALTLGATLDRVLTIVHSTRAPGTLRQYRLLARQLRAEFGEDTDLREIDLDRVRDFLHRERDGQPWSPRSQAQKVALGQRFWRDALEREAAFAEKHRTRPRYRPTSARRCNAFWRWRFGTD